MEEFNRFIRLIGIEKFEKLKDTTVLIVGVGGVGGYTVEALARSGIGSLILVDFDSIDLTNKNRQIIALDSTIGQKKVDVFKKRIYDINSWCKVIALPLFFNEETKSIFTDYKIDYVVDACDTISTKKLIIEECLKNNIPFISCMGTGNKLDPSKLEITELKKTSYDPLAKILRKWTKENQIKGNIPVLSSQEIPIHIGESTPGSTSFVPSSAGLLIASHLVCNIIKD